MQPLDILSFPLVGQSLIEASAGTGKTFTITALYNRLLLAHNTELPALGCDQILVVTFTRAATEELRGRIRERIRNSFEDCLRLLAGAEPQDSAFATLVSEYSDQQLQQLSRWLQANLAQMDEASVFTIHGFCQRILKQFAFDSGVMFDSELVLDSEQYLQQACEDVWRRQCYALNTAQSRYWLNRYAGPDALLQRFRSWLSRPGVTFVPTPDTTFQQQGFSAQWQTLQQLFEQLAGLWQSLGRDAIGDLISASGVDKRSYSSRNLPRWLSLVDDYFNGEFYLAPVAELEKFCASVLIEKTKKGQAPDAALFDQVEHFWRSCSALAVQLDIALFDQVRQRYFELLEAASALTPDDLLRLLSLALSAEQGTHLARQIRQQYPVAMIDEFQDTDPQQYDIFNAIYPAQSPHTSVTEPQDMYGLYMIGDPKQAIYGFRGADIFTYIQARRALSQSQRFTLATNWRSHSHLIAAVNHLWQQHPSPFVFDQDIEFVPVKAAAQHDANALTLGGEPQVAMQLWCDETPLSRRDAQQLAAQQCARQIAALIHGDAARLGNTAVEAKDIAVLVRSRKQAGLIREQLSAHRVGSVFLTRDSVFDSQEARDVLAWMNAVQNPADERLVRTALATETQGLTAHTLDQLLIHEPLWEQQLQQFLRYQQQWRKRGIMAALMLWLEEPKTPQHSQQDSPIAITDQRSLAVALRDGPDGERRLTNLMHLGELLQAASRKIRGQQGLIRWFGERIFDPDRSGEEAQLRLETDANLVTIVTIHKSKGLEYPLVFLPFLWDDSFIPSRMTEAQYYQGYDQGEQGNGQNNDAGGHSTYNDDNSHSNNSKTNKASSHQSQHRTGVVLDLSPDDDAKQLAVRDIKAEYLRLLYVALTRAKYGCYLWLMNAVDGRSKKSQLGNTALGYLCGIEQQPDWQVLADQLSHPDILLAECPDWLAQYPIANQAADNIDPVMVQPFAQRLQDDWRVSSYSQLTAHSLATSALSAHNNGSDIDWQDPQLQTLDWEVQSEVTPAAEGIATIAAPAYALSFPKGANPGTCLHAILELWDFRSREQLLDIAQQQLNYYAIDEDVDALSNWLTDVVNTPLRVPDTNGTLEFCLADLTAGQRLDEMEFHLPVPMDNVPLTAARIHQLMPGKHLQFDALSGYLKGFIDLIFCYAGRYYVADYKSNHLGDRVEDYAADALRASMDDHHYDIQAWLYTVALDRLLSRRIADYDPQQHLGGVFYFYLRGMTPEFTQMAASSMSPAEDLFASEQTSGVPGPDAQAPGVFFQTIDCQQLEHWRALFSSSLSSGATPNAGVTDV